MSPTVVKKKKKEKRRKKTLSSSSCAVVVAGWIKPYNVLSRVSNLLFGDGIWDMSCPQFVMKPIKKHCREKKGIKHISKYAKPLKYALFL